MFRFLKSLIKRTQFGLGCSKDGAPCSDSFAISRAPIRTKRSTSFFNISVCSFDTGYGLNHIGIASSFNLNYTGAVLQVPSIPWNNFSIFCNSFSNSLRFIYVRCWHLFSISLFKSSFSYLESKITRNLLLEVRTCSGLCISSV